MDFLKRYQFFISRSMTFMILSLLIILFTDKNNLHINLNSYHNLFFDLFFKIVTHLGDGIFLAIIGLIFLFIHIKTSIAIIIGGLSSMITVQFLKRVVFPDAMRPVKCIGDIESLNLVDNVQILTHFSFPSGHAATAFLMAGSLCMFFNKAVQQKWLALFALIIAFSRVYLSLHFIEDITAGALIGTITALIGIWVSERINIGQFQRVNIPSLLRKK